MQTTTGGIWNPGDFPPTCKHCGLVLIPGTDKCADCDSLLKQLSRSEELNRELVETLESVMRLLPCGGPEMRPCLYCDARELVARVKEMGK